MSISVLREVRGSSPDIANHIVASDPFGAGVNQYAGTNKTTTPIIRKGVVSRSCGSCYDYDVRVGGTIWKCVKSANLSSPYYGSSEISNVLEGSEVIVYKDFPAADTGIILGVVPAKHIKRDNVLLPPIPRISLESGIISKDSWEHVYMSSVETENNMAPHGRPIDVSPGEWHLTDVLYGSRLSHYGPIAEIVGSPLAKVRSSAIDDSVSIHADTFKQYLSSGDNLICDDGGFILSEENVSTYKHERLGEESEGGSFIERTSDYLNGLKSKLGKRIKSLIPISRLKVFKGYLGGVFHAIVTVPGTNSNDNDKENDDAGVCSLHVGEDGRTTLKTTAGFTMMLVDTIPTPKRKKFPWDPEGTVASEVDFTSKYKEPYEYHNGVSGTLAEVRSAEAYRTARALEPFIKFEDDFDLPEKGTEPPNEVDKTSGRTYTYKKGKENMAVFTVEPDGTLIVGGGKGCEFMMRDGKIIFNAPNGIFMSSGKDIIQLAGNDIVHKAYNNIENISTKGDVRTKAENNLHMVAASSSKGSVVIESKSRGGLKASGEGKETEGSGVLIKCEEGDVGIDSNKVSIKAEANVDIVTDEGNITLSTSSFDVGANNTTISSGPAMLMISMGSAILSGSSATIAGGSANIFNGGKVVKEWQDGESTPYQDSYKDISVSRKDAIEDKVEEFHKGVEDFNVTYIGEYDDTILEGIREPEWSTNKEIYSYTPTNEWEDTELGGTLPWPGDEAIFTNVSEFDNIDFDTWDDIKNTDGEIEDREFREFPRN